MPFNYPSAGRSILEGNEIYRITRLSFIKEEETVFGSLIPIDVGFNAIAVGPNSGFDNYEVYYPDPLIEGGIARADFSSGAPFIASVAPNAADTYEGSNGVPKISYIRPTRSLILGGDNLGGDLVIPLIDIIAYTGKIPPAISQERSPIRRDGYFATTGFAAGHAIEGFGRKAFSAIVKNNTSAASGVDVNVSIEGLIVSTVKIGGDPNGIPIPIELLASTPVPKGGGQLKFAHDSVMDGYYDYYVVKASSASDEFPSDNEENSLFISLQVQD